jgi:hypothetical protein
MAFATGTVTKCDPWRAIAFDEIDACLCGLRDLKREDVAIPPPCGQGIGGLRPPSLNRTPMLRIGYASGGDAQHRPEAEAGVVETSEARSQAATSTATVVAYPHPTGLRHSRCKASASFSRTAAGGRLCSIPTRGRDKSRCSRSLSYPIALPLARLPSRTNYLA